MTADHARKIRDAVDALDRATYNLRNHCEMPQPNDENIAAAGVGFVEAQRELAQLTGPTTFPEEPPVELSPSRSLRSLQPTRDMPTAEPAPVIADGAPGKATAPGQAQTSAPR